jgi:quinol monooxygenase YgiN
MYNLIINIKAKKSDYNNQIKFHLNEMSKECPNESGCILWKAYQNEQIESDFFIVESWETKQSWEEHMKLNTFINHYENGLLKLIEREISIVKEI